MSPRLELAYLDDKGELATPSVLAQLDARTKATLRADLPAAAKELKIGGSGVEQVAGTVTLDGTGDPIREFFTTAATTFKANGTTTPIGAYTAVVWRRTSSGSWGFQVVQDAWVTPAATPDTTAPVAGTLVLTATTTTVTATVTGASDDRGVSGYRFTRDNAATWSAWQPDPAYTFTGLTLNTAYTVGYEVKDAAGNTTRGSSKSITTPAEVIPSGAYDDAVLALSPTAYWPLDDPAGTTSPRNLGSRPTPALTTDSGVTLGTQGIGDGATAATFTSGSAISGDGAFMDAVPPVSVAALVKPTSTNHGVLTDSSAQCAVVSGRQTLRSGSNIYTSTGRTLIAGRRYHLGWVLTSTEARFYVDGVLDATVPATFTAGGTKASIGIACGQWAVGTIAGVALKSGAAWTATEMGQLAKAAGLA